MCLLGIAVWFLKTLLVCCAGLVSALVFLVLMCFVLHGLVGSCLECMFPMSMGDPEVTGDARSKEWASLRRSRVFSPSEVDERCPLLTPRQNSVTAYSTTQVVAVAESSDEIITSEQVPSARTDRSEHEIEQDRIPWYKRIRAAAHESRERKRQEAKDLTTELARTEAEPAFTDPRYGPFSSRYGKTDASFPHWYGMSGAI